MRRLRWLRSTARRNMRFGAEKATIMGSGHSSAGGSYTKKNLSTPTRMEEPCSNKYSKARRLHKRPALGNRNEPVTGLSTGLALLRATFVADGQLVPALGPASCQHLATAYRGSAGAKTMLVPALPVAGLERTLHNVLSILMIPCAMGMALTGMFRWEIFGRAKLAIILKEAKLFAKIDTRSTPLRKKPFFSCMV